MNQSKLFFPSYTCNFLRFIGIIFICLMAIGWLFYSVNPSDKELIGDTAKIWEYNQIGFNNWIPYSLMGYSSILQANTLLPILISSILQGLLGNFLTALNIEKIFLILVIVMSGLSMRFFVSRLTSKECLADIAGLIYILMPTFNISVAKYEHWSVACCFIFVPLIFRGVFATIETYSLQEIIGLGISLTGLLFSYSKIAFLLFPIILFWSVVIVIKNGSSLIKSVVVLCMSAGVFLISSILLLIPLCREMESINGFRLDPLNLWQIFFCYKSPILWLNNWNILTHDADANISTMSDMFVLGIIPLLVIFILLVHPFFKNWRKVCPLAFWFFLALHGWLIAVWFSFGPKGIISNHFYVLSLGKNLPNFSIPLIWLSFILFIWMIYSIISYWIQNIYIRISVCFIIVVLPIFRIINFLPDILQIRSPESYARVTGTVLLSMATAIAIWVILTECVIKKWRTIVLSLFFLFLFLENYPIYSSSYWSNSLSDQYLKDWAGVTSFLHSAPIPGRVHFLSSRYIYLTLPQMTGRYLDIEALWHHLIFSKIVSLQALTFCNINFVKNYNNMMGVGYIVLDKSDTSLSENPGIKDYIHLIENTYPLVFCNYSFAIFENRDTLYPAFFGKNVLNVSNGLLTDLGNISLALISKNIITLDTSIPSDQLPGCIGTIDKNDRINIIGGQNLNSAKPLQRITYKEEQKKHSIQLYNFNTYDSGWLVISQAYHRDWRAMIDGHETPIFPSENGLSAVYIPLGTHSLSLIFKPPFWYSYCFVAEYIIWLLLVVAVLYFCSSWPPTTWKRWWTKPVI